jgi:isopropylmalate/homocitrate/citramalate synthase
MLYQHIDPALVGNDMRMLVSDMAGRASVELKGRELGFDLSQSKEVIGRVTDKVKSLRRAATPSRQPTPRSSCCSATSWRASAGGTSPSNPGG